MGFEMVLKNFKAQAAFTRSLASRQQEVDGEVGVLSKQHKQAVKKGEWVPITCLFDEDIAKLRSSMVYSRREYKRPREGDQMDFNDYLSCLAKLGVLYAEAGQANLAIQTMKLMRAALNESASKTKVSIIRACERLRKKTRHDVVWGSDSLGRHDVQVLLEDIPRKEKPKDFPRPKDIPVRKRKRFSRSSLEASWSGLSTSQIGVQLQVGTSNHRKRVWSREYASIGRRARSAPSSPSACFGIGVRHAGARSMIQVGASFGR